MRTPLIRSLDGKLGDSADAAGFLRGLDVGEGDLVLVDGFLVGESPELAFALDRVLRAPMHRGILSYQGSQSVLRKTEGTRLLRRFDSPILATQMLKNCGKQNGSFIEVFGMEIMSSSRILSIEINSVTGCQTAGVVVPV